MVRRQIRPLALDVCQSAPVSADCRVRSIRYLVLADLQPENNLDISYLLGPGRRWPGLFRSIFCGALRHNARSSSSSSVPPRRSGQRISKPLHAAPGCLAHDHHPLDTFAWKYWPTGSGVAVVAFDTGDVGFSTPASFNNIALRFSWCKIPYHV